MFEVELKFPVPAPDALRAKILRLGGTAQAPQRHRDTYFNHPARDFYETDEALRIRRVNGVPKITYKGPKRPFTDDAQNGTDASVAAPLSADRLRESPPKDEAIKARRELEWTLAPGDSSGEKTEELLVALGFQRVATVSKRRSPFHVPPAKIAPTEAATSTLVMDVVVTIDHVAELDPDGWYAEVEVVLQRDQPTAAEVARARATVESVAAGLDLTAPERRSYLVLALERRGDL